MAISTYTELQTALGNWLHRSDLTARLPEFVALAEAQMNRRLRVRRMVTRLAVTIDAELESVPSDYAGVRAFHLETDPITPLVFVPPDDLVDWKASASPAGKPTRFTVLGGQFQFLPPPDGTYDGVLTYYARIPALASNSTNWLLTDHPDAYLYGSLTQAAPYIKDDERVALWAQLFETALSDITSDDARASYHRAARRLRSF